MWNVLKLYGSWQVVLPDSHSSRVGEANYFFADYFHFFKEIMEIKAQFSSQIDIIQDLGPGEFFTGQP